MIRFFQQMPVHEFISAKKAETWILEHLPDHLRWLRDDIAQLRYHLTHIDFAHKPYPRWKLGINEIVNGIH